MCSASYVPHRLTPQAIMHVFRIICASPPHPSGDHVYQPFEPELDWSRFGVAVAEADVPHLHTLLDQVDDKQLARMQVRLGYACRYGWGAHAGTAGARMLVRLGHSCRYGWGMHAGTAGARMQVRLGCWRGGSMALPSLGASTQPSETQPNQQRPNPTDAPLFFRCGPPCTWCTAA